MRGFSRHQLRVTAGISGAAIVLLVLVLLLWLVPARIDQSRWRGWFEHQASAATGRAVTIGKISVHLLPTPGLDAERITIANPAWAAQPFLATIDHLSAQFRIASLWHRTLQVAHINADGVLLDIESDAAHAGNWQMTAQNNQTRQADANHLSALRSIDLQRVTLHFTRHIARHIANQTKRETKRHTTPQTASEKHDFGNWQLPAVHVAAQGPGRDITATAVLNHAQRTMTISASLDTIAAPTHALLSVASGDARVVIDARRLQSARVSADTFATQLDATRLDQLLAFFQIESRQIAPVQMRADVRADGNKIDFAQLAGSLGETRAGGSAQLDLDGVQPTLHAQLSIPRLDWVRMLADAGRPPLPPKPPGELFRTHLLPWRVLAAAHGMRADMDLHVAAWKTRSGIELSNANAQVHIEDGQLQANAMHAQMLGGTAAGTLHLVGADQSAQLKLQLHDVSLHDGLRAMGKATPLNGGSMQLNATVNARGESMKALAATLTGPVTITLGPTRIVTAAGARSEEMLTGLLPYFSAHDSTEIHLECGSAMLPFQAGRALGSPLIGVRSQASELLTQGDLDLRTQTLDVRGRARSRSGFSLGLSAVSGDIRFSGPLVHPRARLDSAGTPGAIARVGAAVVTGGLSLIGTALWDHAHPGVNPCEAVLAPHASTRSASRLPDRSPNRSPKAVP